MRPRHIRNDRLTLQKAMTSDAEWTKAWRGIALFVVACTLVVASLAFLQSGSGKVEWPVVLGAVQDTRIVADHARQIGGGQLIWRADYKVAYSVAGREYIVWADSGIRDESEDGVRLVMPKSRPSCWVRYNPEEPEISTADCR
jgi:hypothetical protein